MPQQPKYEIDFINQYAPYAIKASQETGIPARLILAEAAIESRWGQSGLATQGNNLFGIKAYGSDKQKPTVTFSTGEQRPDGSKYTEVAPFRKFTSPEESFQGFVDFLNKNPRQRVNLGGGGNGLMTEDRGAEDLALANFVKSGYATNVKVAEDIRSRMDNRIPKDLSKFTPATSYDPALNKLQNIIGYDSQGAFNAPIVNDDVSAGLGDSFYGSFGLNGITAQQMPKARNAIDRLSDGFTDVLEDAGNTALSAFNNLGRTFGDLIGGTPAEAATPSQPAPGDYDFANGGSPGGIGDPNFGAGITPSAPTGPAPGPYDFAGGLAAGGNTPNGSFGSGIGSSPEAPGPYAFAGGLAVGGNVPNGSFGDGITQPGAQPAPTLPPSQVPTIGAGPQAAAVPFNGFDAKAYLAANQDVAASATYANNPLQHYLDFGYAEGRTLDPQGHQITQGVDFSRYLADNPDVAAARLDPLAHYLVNGASEGRTLAPGSTGTIIGAPSAVSGLSPSGFAPTLGPTAGQSVTASPGIGPYDFSAGYLNQNQDVAAAGMGAFEHYARFGAKEGRAINAAGDRFDPNAYLAQNVDVLQAGQDPLTHYLTWGANEGRAAPLIGADGTVHNVASLGVTPTISASLAPYLQPQGTAPTLPPMQAQTIGAPGLSSTLGPQTASTIGPSAAQNVGSFDAAAYLQANPDVAASARYGSNPLEHYETYGFNENRALDASGLRLNQVFDGNSYLGMNPDVASAGMNPLDHYLRFGMQEGRQIGAPGATPWVMPTMAPTIGAQQGATLGPQSAPTIGPDFTSTIGAGPAVQAFSPSYNPPISDFGFGGNVSQGVAPGSFGAGITPQAPISSWGFSGSNPSGALGAQPQGFGGSFGIGSAVSNMDAAPASSQNIDPYSFGSADVSGFDVNQGGGAPAAQEAPVALGYGDGGAIQGRNSQLSQNEYFATQARQQALATANANLFGQQITGIAPGNQTVYDYATGKATGGPAPQIQPFAQAPVNMSAVFAPLATAAFMPRFTF